VSGTITEIRKSGGDTPRVTVFVDGVEAFTVSEDVARELGLSVGHEMVPAAAERLTSGDERTKVREAALRLLAVRARSAGELSDHLRRKGFREESTAAVIASLSEVGLVDDEAFAIAWVDEKVRLRPTGPRRLTQEVSGGVDDAKRRARLHSFLLRRGFSYEVVSTVLKEIKGDPNA